MSGMAGRDRGGDAVLRAFARDLAKMRRDLRNLEAANQISSASIEGGTLDVYDDDDVLRERIGKQANGSYGRLVLEGPVPPIPSEPDVQVIADGVVAITWDGRCEEKWPFVEFEAVRVHLVSDPVNEVCDRDNQVGVIRSHRGETIVAVTESDDDNPVYARLVAVSTAGHTSDPSPAVLVDELDEDDLEEEQEELEWEDGDGRPITQAEVDAGEVVLSLSHDPEVESMSAVLAGAPQRPSNWTIDYDARTLKMTLSGWEEAGDVLWVHYPYYSGAPSVVVPFESAGWRYLQVAQADSTNRSAPGFDDSPWATASAAFGEVATGTPYPEPATAWGINTALWLRRTVVAEAARALTITIRTEVFAAYWNGVLIGSAGNAAADEPLTEHTITVAAGDVTGNDVLAVRASDDAVTGSGSAQSYIDVQVAYS